MMRVKLPFGGTSAGQLDAFGEIAERYAPLRRGHITTRQNIQYHHYPLAKATEMLRLLGESGLSTHEACGNVVRNVTGDPWAGVRPDEPFDVSPYAGAFSRYWVRNELTPLLPRKFKVAFSGSDEDAAMGDIHDLGFVAKTKIIDGKEVKGFRLVTGGGLSTMAKRALLLREFVSVDDYLRVSEAVLRIFNRTDWLRKNIAKARLKFLVQQEGEEAFQQMVDEELKGDWARQDYPLDELIFDHDEESVAPKPSPDAEQPNDGDREAYEQWVQRLGAAPGGLLHRRGAGAAGRPLARAVPRAGDGPAEVRRGPGPHDPVAEHRAALDPRREPLRGLEGARRAGPRRRRRARGDRCPELPRHR
jgi:sulfite reductase beta subunit-like hemoprotein